MIEIKYNIHTFIKPETQQVVIRVRWNRKKNETVFIPGVYADPGKWDYDGKKAKKSTTHIVGAKRFFSYEINDCISDYIQEIELAFNSYALSNVMPTPSQLKMVVNKALGREEKITESNVVVKKKNITELLEEFLLEGEREKTGINSQKRSTLRPSIIFSALSRILELGASHTKRCLNYEIGI